MISIIIPTMTGRETSLERALAAYQRNSIYPNELVIIKDAPSWSTGCNQGAEQANGLTLHFSADDLEPQMGWDAEAFWWLQEHDELPAPVVLNHSADGDWDNKDDGADGELTHFTRIPIMRRDQYDRIGKWPTENYVADIWLSEKARTLGIETRMIHSYRFVHHWEQAGRDDGPDVQHKAQVTLRKLRAGMKPFKGLPHNESTTGRPAPVPFYGVDDA